MSSRKNSTLSSVLDISRNRPMPEHHAWTLSFVEPHTELAYTKYFLEHHLSLVRKFYMLASGLYVIFSAFLVVLVIGGGDSRDPSLLIAFRGTASLLAVFFVTLLHFRRFYRHYEWLTFLIPLVITSGIFAELAFLANYEAGADSGLAGIILIMSAASIVGRMRMVWYAVYSAISVLMYTGVMIKAQQDFPDDISPAGASLSVFFLVCGSATFTYASRTIETSTRLAFHHSLSLLTDNQKLRTQLRSIHRQLDPTRLDLESPLEKCTQTLKHLMTSPEMPGEFLGDIETVLHVISTQEFHNTNLKSQLETGSKRIDDETQQWLFYELAAKENKLKKRFGRLAPIDHEQALNRRGSLSGTTLGVLLPDEEAKLKEILAKFNDWDFDAIALNNVTNGRPLFFLAMHVFRSLDLFQTFKIPQKTFAAYVTAVEERYKSQNPYHNSIHATDVLHATVYLTSLPDVAPFLSELDLVSVLIAAIIHDVDHPGLNNNFQIATRNDLALVYNDKSVLENHHVSTAFRMLFAQDEHCLSALSETQFKTLRETVIDLVLATDISRHFEIVSTFKARAEVLEEGKRSDVLLVLQMILKCADVSNPAKPETIYQAWAKRVMDEFYLQGDHEKTQRLPVSPFMDREKPAYERCQHGFINFIVLPLFEAFEQRFGDDRVSWTAICTEHRDSFARKLETSVPASPSTRNNG